VNIPPEWFVEPLMKLAVACAEHTMTKKPVLHVVVARDFGLLLGVAPGEVMEIATPAGYIEVYSEK
jgi:hypothetical protein